MNPLFLLSKAETALNKGRREDALRHLTQAQKTARDPFLSAEIHWHKAETLRALGRFRSALADYWASHKYYRRAGANPERLRALLGASGCLRVLGRYQEARRMWNSVRGKSWTRVVDPPREAVGLETALVARGLGRHQAALKILNRFV